jgi:hypothetical protein
LRVSRNGRIPTRRSMICDFAYARRLPVTLRFISGRAIPVPARSEKRGKRSLAAFSSLRVRIEQASLLPGERLPSRYLRGSTGTPSLRISKCRCGAVLFPVLPTAAIDPRPSRSRISNSRFCPRSSRRAGGKRLAGLRVESPYSHWPLVLWVNTRGEDLLPQAWLAPSAQPRHFRDG